MTTLRVGMRVRVVRVMQPWNLGLLGRVGVITERVEFSFWRDPLFGLDGLPVTLGPRGWVGFGPDQLEPIIDPGAQPSEYASLAELLESLGVEA